MEKSGVQDWLGGRLRAWVRSSHGVSDYFNLNEVRNMMEYVVAIGSGIVGWCIWELLKFSLGDWTDDRD